MVGAKRRVGWLGIVAVLGALGALWATAPATAGPPGKWTRVTEEAAPSNTSEVGLERTADGVLHVLWRRDSGSTEQVVHTSISANARTLSGPHPVSPAAHAINPSVDLVPGPGGGIRALFAGLFEGAPAFAGGVATATSADGSAWSAVGPASENDPKFDSDGRAYIAAGIGGGVTPSGTVISIWGDSSSNGAAFHVGLDPAVPDVPLSPSLCESNPNVAVDSASGEVILGWNCLSGDSRSLQVRPLSNGAVATAPSSGAVWLQQRIGLSGRIGAGGVYAAYGTGTNPFNARPGLWRVGDPKAKVIKQPRDAEHTTLAPAPGGRLWIVWEGKDRGKRIFATRTNPAATRFGAIVSIRPPKGTQAIHRLAAEGSRGFLDVIALVQRGSNEIAHWHQRLLPGLSLSAKPGKVAAGKTVTFKVTDAGQAIGKAKVTLKLGKKQVSAKTKANGEAKLKIPKHAKPKRYRATARKQGYAPGKRAVRVK